jgi:Putative peptidoglycan binding domain
MSRDLFEGTSGPDVRNLQRILNFHFRGTAAKPLTVDGNFGNKTAAAVIRIQRAAHLYEDGVVGTSTAMALFPMISVLSAAMAYKTGKGATLARLTQLRSTAMAQSSACKSCLQRLPLTLAPTGAPGFTRAAAVPDPPAPIIKFQNLVVGAGNAFAWNAYAPSPIVFSGSATMVLRWSDIGFTGLKISPGGQVAVNGLRSPNGDWTGQGAVQLTPIIPSLDKYTKLFGGRLDLGMPSVSAFVQKNENQKPWQAGVGFALNPALALIRGPGDDPILSLSLNLALIAAGNLTDGKGQPVSPQITPAIMFDIWQVISP